MLIVVIMLIIGYPLVLLTVFPMIMVGTLLGVFNPTSATVYEVPLGNQVPTPRSKEELRECIWRYITGNSDKYIHISKWNVSHITDMSGVCANMITTKQLNHALSGIEEWDMSNVLSTFAMFKGCSEFNQPIGKWTLHRVYRISEMFQGCCMFNQNLDDWETTLGKNNNRVECYEVFQVAYKPECEHPRWLRVQRKRQQDYDNYMEMNAPWRRSLQYRFGVPLH
jgi:hypothetical protein